MDPGPSTDRRHNVQGALLTLGAFVFISGMSTMVKLIGHQEGGPLPPFQTTFARYFFGFVTLSRCCSSAERRCCALPIPAATSCGSRVDSVA